MPDTNQTDHERTYQIGTVATLTGIDPHTIRAWERRYRAIRPLRTESGRRRYDDAAVERLQLLKALVACNEAIGTIAALSDDSLRERLEKLADHESHRPGGVGEASAATGRVRLGAFGTGVIAQIEAKRGDLPEFELSIVSEEREDFLESARRERCEIVLLELDAVGKGALGFVQACRQLPGNPIIVVLYRFASRPSLARLAGSGATLIKAPIRLAQMRRIILDQIVTRRAHAIPKGSDEAAPRMTKDSIRGRTIRPPERRFDDSQLARLLEISSSIDCECPNHVSSLVGALVAFENYSVECESRDEADVRLHDRLATGTGAVRAEMESMLADLCEHEGIVVE